MCYSTISQHFVVPPINCLSEFLVFIENNLRFWHICQSSRHGQLPPWDHRDPVPHRGWSGIARVCSLRRKYRRVCRRWCWPTVLCLYVARSHIHRGFLWYHSRLQVRTGAIVFPHSDATSTWRWCMGGRRCVVRCWTHLHDTNADMSYFLVYSTLLVFHRIARSLFAVGIILILWLERDVSIIRSA